MCFVFFLVYNFVYLFVRFFLLIVYSLFLFVPQYVLFCLCIALKNLNKTPTIYMYIGCMVFGEIVNFQCHFGLLLEMGNGFCVWNQLTRLVSNVQVICIVDLVLGMMYKIYYSRFGQCVCVCECVYAVWPACIPKFSARNVHIYSCKSNSVSIMVISIRASYVQNIYIFITTQIQIVIYKRLPVDI